MELTNIRKELLNVSFETKAEVGIDVQLHQSFIPSELCSSQQPQGLIIICHSGRISCRHFESEHALHSRDMVVLFPGDIYTLSNASDDFSCSWVSFNAEAAKRILEGFPTAFFHYIAKHPIYTLTDNSQYANRMEYLKMLAARLAESDNICRYEIAHLQLRSLFMEILNRIVQNFNINTSEPKHRQRLLDEFIRAVKATPRCREVAYFAQRLNVTPKHLSNIVADGTGFTAKEFIERNAISEIEQLLSNSRLTVAQIAERLNFSGNANLCRFYKSNRGITISDFKRKIKG